MLNRVLATLVVAFLTIVAAVTFVVEDASQSSQMRHAALETDATFTIEDTPSLSDPAVVDAALRDAASSTRANIFRTSVGYASDGSPRVVIYVLLAQDTHLFDRVPLVAGRYPEPAETSVGTSTACLSTDPKVHCTGTIRDFGTRDVVEVRPWSHVFTELPTAGVYQVETPSGVSPTDVVNAITSAVVSPTGEHLDSSEISVTAAPHLGDEDGYRGILVALALALLGATALLLAYRQLHQTKVVGIMGLHGHGQVRIWFESTGRLLLLPSVATVVVLGVAAAAVPQAPASFVGKVLAVETAAIVSLLVVSAFASSASRRVPVFAAIKNRRRSGGVFVVDVALKSLVTTTLLLIAAGLVNQYQNAIELREELAPWATTDDYGIFYPVQVGDDLLDLASGGESETSAEVFDLYPKLNADGALYVDGSSFEDAPTTMDVPAGDDRGLPSLTVNPNYLDAYPIDDAAGRPVHIDEATTDWVVLVPESLRADEAAIVAQVTAERASAVHTDEALFHRDVPPSVAQQSVTVVSVAAGQSVFTFNRNVPHGSTVRDPIVQVMTSANSTGADRMNMITGDQDAALKVRLVGKDPSATLAALQPLLDSVHLDDNLPHLITMEDYVVQQLQDIERGVRAVAITGLVLAVVLLALIAQYLTVAFEMFTRKIVVRRLHGASFAVAYREVVAIVVAVWSLQVLGALGALAMQANPFAFSGGQESAATLMAVVGAALGFEALLSLAFLSRLERRRLTSALKEDF